MSGAGFVEDLTAWAQHVEETYIAETLGRPKPALPPELAAQKARLGEAASEAASEAALDAIAAGTACAVAARFLAVGKPRSLGVLSDDPVRAVALWAAHRVWHQPSDVRASGGAAAELVGRGARAVTAAEALTADIVCVDVAMLVENRLVRRGSHLNLLAPGIEVEQELSDRAQCYGETMQGAPAKTATLGDLAAGLRDGRQLDEITLLFAGPTHGGGRSNGLALARAALGLPRDR